MKINKKYLERFKCWELWLAISALIIYVIKIAFNFDCGEIVNNILNYILPILIILGIVKNPNNNKYNNKRSSKK